MDQHGTKNCSIWMKTDIKVIQIDQILPKTAQKLLQTVFGGHLVPERAKNATKKSEYQVEYQTKKGQQINTTHPVSKSAQNDQPKNGLKLHK